MRAASATAILAIRPDTESPREVPDEQKNWNSGSSDEAIRSDGAAQKLASSAASRAIQHNARATSRQTRRRLTRDKLDSHARQLIDHTLKAQVVEAGHYAGKQGSKGHDMPESSVARDGYIPQGIAKMRHRDADWCARFRRRSKPRGSIWNRRQRLPSPERQPPARAVAGRSANRVSIAARRCFVFWDLGPQLAHPFGPPRSSPECRPGGQGSL